MKQALQFFVAIILLSGCRGFPLFSTSVKQVQYLDVFDPPRNFLSLSVSGLAAGEIDQRLIQVAVFDGERMGVNLVFVKAIKNVALQKVFYVFEVSHHDDLYWVYATDADQKALEYKFKFFPV